MEGKTDSRFVRIHQRYLINGDRVDHIGHDQVEICGKELPISRGMKDAAVAKLAECMLKGIG
ncbi:LytTR family transcriptional regulator DNA-binding domain-containing protein [uncultured Blautia sp.]|uniref:LytTR family transcriptional regulator DNA-binding domain-containing protein n=1 Tax=uncultured Blautia sp. TaxID=765821 RepID=UPI00280B7415|nr:LytTR family transcriptional regulator DNA-binding domain-containing protein [uncultured Blautia sp.]